MHFEEKYSKPKSLKFLSNPRSSPCNNNLPRCECPELVREAKKALGWAEDISSEAPRYRRYLLVNVSDWSIWKKPVKFDKTRKYTSSLVHQPKPSSEESFAEAPSRQESSNLSDINFSSEIIKLPKRLCLRFGMSSSLLHAQKRVR